MKGRIGITAVVVVLGALLGASPVHATTAALSPACTAGSYSEMSPPYQTHWRIGQNGSLVYWLHSQPGAPGPELNRLPYADYFICQPLAHPGAHSIAMEDLVGQPACTSAGTFFAIVDGKIASYEFVGQQATLTGYVLPTLRMYRFWHIKVQVQPGQWSLVDPLVSVC